MARLSAAEADTNTALEHVEELELTVAELTAELNNLRVEYEGDENSDSRLELWEELGTKGEHYGLRMYDLAVRLLSRRLTAAQARGVCRDFLSTLYPGKVEGKNYRVPNLRRWQEWRLWLKPIARHVAVLALMQADRFHSGGDATTKRRIGFMGTVHKGEFHRADGSTFTQDICSGLDVIEDGSAETEANAMHDSLEVRCRTNTIDTRLTPTRLSPWI